MTSLIALALCGGVVFTRAVVGMASGIWHMKRKRSLQAVYRPYQPSGFERFHTTLNAPRPWYVKVDNWLSRYKM